eukprot:66080-Amphidinium_carterae.1
MISTCVPEPGSARTLGMGAAAQKAGYFCMPLVPYPRTPTQTLCVLARPVFKCGLPLLRYDIGTATFARYN